MNRNLKTWVSGRKLVESRRARTLEPNAVAASPMVPVRGVFREPSARTGYVLLTVVDSQGGILASAEMLAEWCDEELLDFVRAKLARSDPDHEHRPFATLTPDASVLPFRSVEAPSHPLRLVPVEAVGA